jgi:hypothetical protein
MKLPPRSVEHRIQPTDRLVDLQGAVAEERSEEPALYVGPTGNPMD